MKSIIDGFRFDTDKSVLIGKAKARCSIDDFSYWEAALYKTPRVGRFFLAGRGGPMSRWGKRHPDGCMSGGEGIIPLQERDAYLWAKQNLDAKVLEQYFNDKNT